MVEKGEDMGALLALSQLSALLSGVPVLNAASPEVTLVAGELNSWAAVGAREKLLMLMAQVRAVRAVCAVLGQYVRNEQLHVVLPCSHLPAKGIHSSPAAHRSTRASPTWWRA